MCFLQNFQKLAYHLYIIYFALSIETSQYNGEYKLFMGKLRDNNLYYGLHEEK